MIDLQKHIREGWTIGDFVERLAPELDRIMSGHSWHRPFTSKQELAMWVVFQRVCLGGVNKKVYRFFRFVQGINKN